jgi:cell division transport system ATP-binding protein
MIRLESISLVLNKTRILDNISIQVHRGEFVYLTGPSGAGKSSILKLIHLDLFPCAGAVTIRDVDTRRIPRSQIPFLRRIIGFIFQDYKLLPDRTVYENVAFSLEVTGVKRNAMRHKVLQALYTVGMGNRLNHYPIQLSGGECQRVAIARAIVQEPFLLLADEPTGNLDDENAGLIMELLSAINRCGTTVLMATHKTNLMVETSRRVIRIANGRIVE